MSLVILLGLVIGATLPVLPEESLDYDLPPQEISAWMMSERNVELPRGAFSNPTSFLPCIRSLTFIMPRTPSTRSPRPPGSRRGNSGARKQSVRNCVSFRDALTLCMDLGWLDERA